MHPVDDFRTQYRRDEIGPRYSGIGHFLFTTMGCLAVMSVCVYQIHDVLWWEWLTVPLTFLFANYAEWAGHRGPMHHPVKGLGLVFRRHTHQHHMFFTPERMAYDHTRDYKAVLFPPILLIFFIGAFALPTGLLIAWLFPANVAWLYVFVSVGYFLNYEWLHFAYHMPPDSWIGRMPGLAWLRRHHQLHHDHANMSHRNFNITYPITDWWRGTFTR